MKKSKKLSLQSLALVLMSFVLVAGVAFGMTGAWFTDKKENVGDDVTMGPNVIIETATLAFDLADDEVAMPGDEIAVTLTVKLDAASSDAMIRIYGGTTQDSELTSTQFTLTFKNGEEDATVGTDAAGAYYFEEAVTAGNSVTLTGTLTLIGAKIGNLDAGKTFEVAYTVEAVQAANYAGNETSMWGSVTAYTEDNVTLG